MEVIRNKRILALVGIIALLLGTFLPYYTFSFLGISKSISLWEYWEGKIVLTLTLANALFIFKDWIEKYVPQLFNNNIGRMVEKANNPKFSLIPTILIAGFAIYMFMKMDINLEYLKHGLGFYSLWIGVIALVGHAIFYKKQTVQPVQSQTVNYQQVQPQQSTQPQQTTMNNQNKKFCPHCGNQVDANATTCFMCENNF